MSGPIPPDVEKIALRAMKAELLQYLDAKTKGAPREEIERHARRLMELLGLRP